MSSRPSTTPRRRSLPGLALAFVLFVCLALASLEAWREWSGYWSDIAEAEAKSLNLAKSLSQHADDSFEIADTILAGLVERVETDGVSPAAVARLERLMASRIAQQPRIRGLFVYDEAGRWLASSSPPPSAQTSNSDRDYFNYHLLSPDRGPFLGQPVQSRSGGQWIITVTRRLQHPDGSFAGVVLASIDVDYFTAFYRRFDVGRKGIVVLIRTDGRILARAPAEDDFYGVDLSGSDLIRSLATRPAGTRQYTSPLDGVARISGYQRAHRFPIVLQVAFARDEVLAPWRTEAGYRAGAVALLIVLVGGLGARLAAQMRRRQRTEAALAESEAKFRLLAENSGDMVTRIGQNGRRLYVSPASRTLLGHAPEELAGRPATEGVHPEDLPEMQAKIAELRAGHLSEVTIPFRTRHRSGAEIWVEASVRVATDPGTGAPDGVVSVVRNITERKRLEAQLAALARLDGLTGIANRRAFDAAFATEWRRAVRERTSLSLLLIDVDHFKSFNDAYGHGAGDACLRAVAEAVAATVSRPGDLAARYGGEEFAVLLPNTDEEGALAVGERVRQAVEETRQPHSGNAAHGRVTVSVGVATCRCAPDRKGPPGQAMLLELADGALYRAKREGRNRVAVAPPLFTIGARASA